MTDATTPNYSWSYPTNNADADTWGTTLNATINAIDGQVKDNDTAASGYASAAQTAAETYADSAASAAQTAAESHADSAAATAQSNAESYADGVASTALSSAEAYTVSYAPSKAGAGASGTWGINISGNAATATSATSAGSATTAGTASALTTSNSYTMAGLTVNGGITATGNVTAYYSDNRLKTRLGNITGALKKVKSLTGFYYEANETAQRLGYLPVREVGLSAQDLQRVLPEVVRPAPIDKKYLTADYPRVIPLLVEAIKELSDMVDALRQSR